MKALVGAFNQEKALVGAFSVIVQPVVEPMDRFTALVNNPGIYVQIMLLLHLQFTFAISSSEEWIQLYLLALETKYLYKRL